MAKKFSKSKLIPTIQKCKDLQQYRYGTKRKKRNDEIDANTDKETLTFFEFKNCLLKLGWAGSINSLAGDPACLVVCDEVSKWGESKNEARSLELALARSITFLDKKQIILSTPAEESTCIVTAEYETGDQRIYEVPSPYTKDDHGEPVYFEIQITDLQKPEDHLNKVGNYDWNKIKKGAWLADPTTRKFDNEGRVTYYGDPIHEHQKAELVRKGRWRATNLNPTDPDCHSYEQSALYSMDTSWGELLMRYIKSKDDVEQLKTLNTQYLGKPWKQIAQSVRLNDLESIVESSPVYMLGTVPEYLGEAGMLLGAVDQQIDRFYYVVQALCESGKSYVIGYGCVLTLDDVEKLSKQIFASIDGKENYVCQKWLIDEGGFVATPIRDFCCRTGFEFVPCKGRSDISNNDAFKNGRIEHPLGSKVEIPYITINDSEMKKMLLLEAIKYQRAEMFFPRNLGDDFKMQLTSEQQIEDGKGGFYWKARGANHYSDCMKYIEALKIYNKQFLPSNVIELEVAV